MDQTTNKLDKDNKNSVPAPTKIITNPFDYDTVFKLLENKGKLLFGQTYNFSHHDMAVIYKLTAYFLRDEKACINNGVDLAKGILLTGPIGCGKTALMTILKYITNPLNKFIIKSARDMTFEFIENGYSIVDYYSRSKDVNHRYRNYCFDDLGLEANMKFFGNECNVLAEILLTRYDLFTQHKLITHLTTNLSATELEDAYGNRLRSRLRQMVNLVSFDLSSEDKRC